MTFPVLSLAQFSLRSDGRAAHTHVARLLVLGLVAAFLFIAHMQARYSEGAGLFFFFAVMFINVAALSLISVSYFASAITEEKEDETLPLMRMTRLNPLAIVLGKSASRVVTTILLLLIQVPFTLLAVSLGGISATQILACYLCLLVYVIFLCCLGVFASVLCPTTRLATALTWGSLLLLLGAPSLILTLLREVFSNNVPAPWSLLATTMKVMIDASPFVMLYHLIAVRPSFAQFGLGLGLQLGAALLLLLLAWWLFDRLCQEGPLLRRRDPQPPAASPNPSATPSAPVVAKAPLCPLDTDAVVAPAPWWQRNKVTTRKPFRLWRDPLAWKEFHFTAGSWVGMIRGVTIYLVAAFFVVLAHLYFDNGYNRDPLEWVTPLHLVFLTGLGLHLCVLSELLFRKEIQENTWSTLMLLPWPLGRLVLSKLAGALALTFPSLLGLVFTFALSPHRLINDVYKEFFTDAPWVMLTLWFVLLIYLIVWISLYVKWGAVGLALTALLAANLLGLMIGELLNLSDRAYSLRASVLVAAAIPFFHWAVYRRLHHLAAQ